MKKSLLDSLLYIVTFLLIQLFTGLVMSRFFGDLQTNATAMIITSAVASMLTIVLFAVLHWSPFSRSYLQSRPWDVLAWVAVLTLGTLIPSVWLTELLGIDLDEAQKQMLSRMLRTPWGYLVVGLAVPLAEEMVFRGALLRTLLKAFHGKAIVPIVLSALVFAAVHGNLAQGLHAFLMGLLLGWLYWRSGSIVPGLVFHWVNNTMAYVLERLYPGIDDVRLVDLCGSELRVWLYVGYSLLVFLPALYQIHLRIKKETHPDPPCLGRGSFKGKKT